MQTMSDEAIALISEPDLYNMNTKRVGCGYVLLNSFSLWLFGSGRCLMRLGGLN